MADPRKVSTNRVGTDPEANQTFLIDASTITYDATASNGTPHFNKAVKISAAGVVALATDASAVHGQLKQVNADGFCRVKTKGVVLFPGGNGATLTAGSKIVGAVDAGAVGGCVRAVAAATLAEVAVARHTILDGSVATAVEVELNS